MIARFHALLLDVFGRLPRPVRRRIVRLVAPTFTVGAICVIERGDGRIALIRQRYRTRWGLPGGLLGRGETAADAARREVFEEIGLEVELLGEPTVTVDPRLRRVDVVFRARPVDPDAPLACRSVEITAAEWFPVSALPDLQPETLTAIASLGLRPSRDR